MITSRFQDKELSLLGFGAMRLPLNADGTVDESTVETMVADAMAAGVNYYDTAWPYHGGTSEIVLGKILNRYPRESWYLADKYPGHQISDRYDPAEIFESQLKKCGVDYFDFYLLHNVYENSIEVYTDPQWKIMDYFIEQKRSGRIRHLGFSTHGGLDCMRRFLDLYGKEMEFCQIQLNWLDWTLQDAKSKVALLEEYGLPVWVMEPVRGGRLCKLDPENEAKLKALRPEETIPGWGFRFLQGIGQVGMILSGMSDPEQMRANLKTFEERKPLNSEELAALDGIAEGMKDCVPCTGCRYCTEQCPLGLNIPLMMGINNELRFAVSTNAGMRLEELPPEKQPSACLSCGACAAMCPQKIDIPAVMRELAERLEKVPKWRKICEERAAAARKLMEEKGC